MPFPKNGQVDPMQQLVASFRSLLDEALIFAIANDHDLQSPTGYQAAHDILKGLSQSTVFEEEAELNLAGISGFPSEGGIDASRDDTSTSATATSTSNQAPKSLESISSGTEISASSSSETANTIPRLTTFSNDNEETKIKHLQGMFTELKKIDITTSLKKANGDFQTALDLLLNIQFLEATGNREKGIDGFFTPEEPASTGGKKQRKRKKKLNGEAESDRGETATSSPVKNIKHEDEIAFIADRIDMSYNQVSDIFYRKRCSAGATVMDILDQYVSLGITAQDDESKTQAKTLGSKYRNIPEHYLLALIQVTSSVAQFSDDIAGILSKYFVKNPRTQRLDLSYRLTPLPSDEIEGATSPVAGKAKSPELRSPLSPISPVPGPSAGVDLSEAVRRLQVSNEAKRDADSYASQLLRRGGSNHLYKQAAVVYRERSHEHAQNSHALTSVAANLLVEKQSTASSIDLHGVTVSDGVRIARQKVLVWWEGLGEYKTRKAAQQSLTVITGIGRHSASGVSRLRQAVAAALLQDGWKMRIETGRFVITGRR